MFSTICLFLRSTPAFSRCRNFIKRGKNSLSSMQGDKLYRKSYLENPILFAPVIKMLHVLSWQTLSMPRSKLSSPICLVAEQQVWTTKYFLVLALLSWYPKCCKKANSYIALRELQGGLYFREIYRTALQQEQAVEACDCRIIVLLQHCCWSTCHA